MHYATCILINKINIILCLYKCVRIKCVYDFAIDVVSRKAKLRSMASESGLVKNN